MGAAAPRRAILAAARRLRERGVYVFFKHDAHFCNPLVPVELERLAEAPELDDTAVAAVVEGLAEQGERLLPGIYSPVPIARGLAAGRSLAGLLEELRYEMIQVDEDQRWSWQGRPVAPRVRAFLLEHVDWEPALGLWLFEYRVSDDWWDKSYFDARITPLLALSAVATSDSGLQATLTSGRRTRLDLGTLRLDDRERLFCGTADLGEVLLSDTLRFELLRGLDETCTRVRIAGRWYPLSRPGPGIGPDTSG